MTETLDNIPVPESGTPSIEWPALQTFSEIREELQRMTPRPWGYHQDPARPGTYYISGAPNTNVVAEGLSFEDASGLTRAISMLGKLEAEYKMMSALWDSLAVDDVAGAFNPSEFMKAINSFQLEIAQLQGNPAPLPPVATAGDLTFMHIGQNLIIPGFEPLPILLVEVVGDGFVKVTTGYGASSNLILSPETKVELEVLPPLTGAEVKAEAEETAPDL